MINYFTSLTAKQHAKSTNLSYYIKSGMQAQMKIHHAKINTRNSSGISLVIKYNSECDIHANN